MANHSKITTSLRIADIEHLAEAAEFAYWLGTPLNRFCSIHLSRAGIDSDELPLFRTIYFQRAREWVITNRGPFHYLYVIENEGGLNMHILMHVPADLRAKFLDRHRQREWLKQAGAKSSIPKHTIKTDPVPRDSNDPHYLANLDNVLSYMVKGANPEACFAYGIDHVPQGAVLGKRSGTSVSLDIAARTRAGYPPPGWPRVLLRMNRLVPSGKSIFERLGALE